MDIQQVFQYWRISCHCNKWGLAWFLANEFCKRYYASHGIAPYVLEHEGLGYYGIALERVDCSINLKSHETLTDNRYGRLAMHGDVENWRIHNPDDERLPLEKFCDQGMPTEELVQRAIAHMNLESVPRVSHYNCRHKRWGASITLCFEVCAFLVLFCGDHGLTIWNHPYHTARLIAERDPNAKQKEHLGAFFIRRNNKELLLAADGRLLDGSGRLLWQMYMAGHSPFALAKMLEAKLDRMPPH